LPLFRSKKNIEYLKRKNRELVQHVIGEKITYYAISRKFTKENVYGEAKEKVFDHPVEIYALVRWGEQEVKTNKFGQDIVYNISFFPLIDTVEELNLSPKEGDFVEYDSKRFEISTITYPRQILGREEESFYLELECVTAREAVFIATLSGTPDVHLNTRPDSDLSSTFKYTDVTFPFSSSYDQ
jgi:hypothetical protein